MSVKHLEITTSSGGQAMRPADAGADMAVNIFKNVSEQDCEGHHSTPGVH